MENMTSLEKFKRGEKVEILESPPPEFGYGDYIVTKGTLECLDSTGVLIIDEKDNKKHWFSMSAVVEIKER